MSDFKLNYIIKKVDKIDDRVRKLEIKSAGISIFISGLVSLGVIFINKFLK